MYHIENYFSATDMEYAWILKIYLTIIIARQIRSLLFSRMTTDDLVMFWSQYPVL